MNISEMRVSLYTENACQKVGVRTMKEIIEFDWSKAHKTKGFGVTAACELLSEVCRLASGELNRRDEDREKMLLKSREKRLDAGSTYVKNMEAKLRKIRGILRCGE